MNVDLHFRDFAGVDRSISGILVTLKDNFLTRSVKNDTKLAASAIIKRLTSEALKQVQGPFRLKKEHAKMDLLDKGTKTVISHLRVKRHASARRRKYYMLSQKAYDVIAQGPSRYPLPCYIRMKVLERACSSVWPLEGLQPTSSKSYEGPDFDTIMDDEGILKLYQNNVELGYLCAEFHVGVDVSSFRSLPASQLYSSHSCYQAEGVWSVVPHQLVEFIHNSLDALRECSVSSKDIVVSFINDKHTQTNKAFWSLMIQDNGIGMDLDGLKNWRTHSLHQNQRGEKGKYERKNHYVGGIGLNKKVGQSGVGGKRAGWAMSDVTDGLPRQRPGGGMKKDDLVLETEWSRRTEDAAKLSGEEFDDAYGYCMAKRYSAFRNVNLEKSDAKVTFDRQYTGGIATIYDGIVNRRKKGEFEVKSTTHPNAKCKMNNQVFDMINDFENKHVSFTTVVIPHCSRFVVDNLRYKAEVDEDIDGFQKICAESAGLLHYYMHGRDGGINLEHSRFYDRYNIPDESFHEKVAITFQAVLCPREPVSVKLNDYYDPERIYKGHAVEDSTTIFQVCVPNTEVGKLHIFADLHITYYAYQNGIDHFEALQKDRLVWCGKFFEDTPIRTFWQGIRLPLASFDWNKLSFTINIHREPQWRAKKKVKLDFIEFCAIKGFEFLRASNGDIAFQRVVESQWLDFVKNWAQGRCLRSRTRLAVFCGPPTESSPSKQSLSTELYQILKDSAILFQDENYDFGVRDAKYGSNKALDCERLPWGAESCKINGLASAHIGCVFYSGEQEKIEKNLKACSCGQIIGYLGENGASLKCHKGFALIRLLPMEIFPSDSETSFVVTPLNKIIYIIPTNCDPSNDIFRMYTLIQEKKKENFPKFQGECYCWINDVVDDSGDFRLSLWPGMTASPVNLKDEPIVGSFLSIVGYVDGGGNNFITKNRCFLHLEADDEELDGFKTWTEKTIFEDEIYLEVGTFDQRAKKFVPFKKTGLRIWVVSLFTNKVKVGSFRVEFNVSSGAPQKIIFPTETKRKSFDFNFGENIPLNLSILDSGKNNIEMCECFKDIKFKIVDHQGHQRDGFQVLNLSQDYSDTNEEFKAVIRVNLARENAQNLIMNALFLQASLVLKDKFGKIHDAKGKMKLQPIFSSIPTTLHAKIQNEQQEIIIGRPFQISVEAFDKHGIMCGENDSDIENFVKIEYRSNKSCESEWITCCGANRELILSGHKLAVQAKILIAEPGEALCRVVVESRGKSKTNAQVTRRVESDEIPINLVLNDNAISNAYLEYQGERKYNFTCHPCEKLDLKLITKNHKGEMLKKIFLQESYSANRNQDKFPLLFFGIIEDENENDEFQPLADFMQMAMFPGEKRVARGNKNSRYNSGKRFIFTAPSNPGKYGCTLVFIPSGQYSGKDTSPKIKVTISVVLDYQKTKSLRFLLVCPSPDIICYAGTFSRGSEEGPRGARKPFDWASKIEVQIIDEKNRVVNFGFPKDGIPSMLKFKETSIPITFNLNSNHTPTLSDCISDQEFSEICMTSIGMVSMKIERSGKVLESEQVKVYIESGAPYKVDLIDLEDQSSSILVRPKQKSLQAPPLRLYDTCDNECDCNWLTAIFESPALEPKIQKITKSKKNLNLKVSSFLNSQYYHLNFKVEYKIKGGEKHHLHGTPKKIAVKDCVFLNRINREAELVLDEKGRDIVGLELKNVKMEYFVYSCNVETVKSMVTDFLQDKSKVSCMIEANDATIILAVCECSRVTNGPVLVGNVESFRILLKPISRRPLPFACSYRLTLSSLNKKKMQHMTIKLKPPVGSITGIKAFDSSGRVPLLDRLSFGDLDEVVKIVLKGCDNFGHFIDISGFQYEIDSEGLSVDLIEGGVTTLEVKIVDMAKVAPSCKICAKKEGKVVYELLFYVRFSVAADILQLQLELRKLEDEIRLKEHDAFETLKRLVNGGKEIEKYRFQAQMDFIDIDSLFFWNRLENFSKSTHHSQIHNIDLKISECEDNIKGLEEHIAQLEYEKNELVCKLKKIAATAKDRFMQNRESGHWHIENFRDRLIVTVPEHLMNETVTLVHAIMLGQVQGLAIEFHEHTDCKIDSLKQLIHDRTLPKFYNKEREVARIEEYIENLKSKIESDSISGFLGFCRDFVKVVTKVRDEYFISEADNEEKHDIALLFGCEMLFDTLNSALEGAESLYQKGIPSTLLNIVTLSGEQLMAGVQKRNRQECSAFVNQFGTLRSIPETDVKYLSSEFGDRGPDTEEMDVEIDNKIHLKDEVEDQLERLKELKLEVEQLQNDYDYRDLMINWTKQSKALHELEISDDNMLDEEQNYERPNKRSKKTVSKSVISEPKLSNTSETLRTIHMAFTFGTGPAPAPTPAPISFSEINVESKPSSSENGLFLGNGGQVSFSGGENLNLTNKSAGTSNMSTSPATFQVFPVPNQNPAFPSAASPSRGAFFVVIDAITTTTTKGVDTADLILHVNGGVKVPLASHLKWVFAAGDKIAITWGPRRLQSNTPMPFIATVICSNTLTERPSDRQAIVKFDPNSTIVAIATANVTSSRQRFLGFPIRPRPTFNPLPPIRFGCTSSTRTGMGAGASSSTEDDISSLDLAAYSRKIASLSPKVWAGTRLTLPVGLQVGSVSAGTSDEALAATSCAPTRMVVSGASPLDGDSTLKNDSGYMVESNMYRRLVTLSYEIFTGVQRLREAPENIDSMIKLEDAYLASHKYRAVVRDICHDIRNSASLTCPQSSPENFNSHPAVSYMQLGLIWHLSDIMFLRGDLIHETGGFIMPCLLELVREFFDPWYGYNPREATTTMSPDDLWIPILRCALLGLRENLQAILQLLIHKRGRGFSEPYLRDVEGLVRKMPRVDSSESQIYTNQTRFLAEWHRWREICAEKRRRAQNDSGNYDMKLIVLLLGVMSGDAESCRSATKRAIWKGHCCHWIVSAVSQMHYLRPDVKIYDLYDLIPDLQRQFFDWGHGCATESGLLVDSLSNGEEFAARILIPIFRGQLNAILLAPGQSSFVVGGIWFGAHLAHLLSSCGLLERKVQPCGSDLCEYLILQHADDIMSYGDQFSIAAEYLWNCYLDANIREETMVHSEPPHAPALLQAYLERIQIDSERTAFKLLSVSRNYDLLEFECSVCVIMGRRYHSQNRLGQSLSWYIRAFDALSRGLHHRMQDANGNVTEWPESLKENIARAQHSYSLHVSQAIAKICSSILVNSVLQIQKLSDNFGQYSSSNNESGSLSDEDGILTLDSIDVLDGLDETFLSLISNSPNFPHTEGRQRLIYLSYYRKYMKSRKKRAYAEAASQLVNLISGKCGESPTNIEFRSLIPKSCLFTCFQEALIMESIVYLEHDELLLDAEQTLKLLDCYEKIQLGHRKTTAATQQRSQGFLNITDDDSMELFTFAAARNLSRAFTSAAVLTAADD
eukprot:UC4_evm2s639